MTLRICPTCGDRSDVLERAASPITRNCRSCAGRARIHVGFSPEHQARARQAWAQQRAQVDPVIVDLLVAGCPERATVAERVAAIRRMPDLSAAQQARKLGVTERSVQRYRAELRRGAA